jgi:hypothetical protein
MKTCRCGAVDFCDLDDVDGESMPRPKRSGPKVAARRPALSR